MNIMTSELIRAVARSILSRFPPTPSSDKGAIGQAQGSPLRTVPGDRARRGQDTQ